MTTKKKFRYEEDMSNAFIRRTRIREKMQGEFSNLTFALKDIIDVKGIATTAGSAALINRIPKKNSYVSRRILALGGTIVGKTNTDEFAMDATNLSSAFGPCLNPLDHSRICGGSSGGSAAAVSAGLSDIGIGTDTGGSTRIPASLCGVYGFKPSTGLIPMDGVIRFSSTLDTIGIISRDISSLKKVFLGLLPGKMKLKKCVKSPRQLKVGFFKSSNTDESEHIRRIVYKVYDTTFEINFSRKIAEGFKVRRNIVTREAAKFHLANHPDLIEKYQPQTKKLLRIGTRIRDSDYLDSLSKMSNLESEYLEIFDEIDLLVAPTTEISAPTIAEVLKSRDYYRELLVRNTGFFNVVGAPSISIPLYQKGKMPIGVMISSYRYDDLNLLTIAQRMSRELNENIEKL